jgi:hypothetical protein
MKGGQGHHTLSALQTFRRNHADEIFRKNPGSEI